MNRAFYTDHTAHAYWPNKPQGKNFLLHKGQRRTSARIVSSMPHLGNLQNRRRILKSGDSWPLVVRRRPSLALHPGMAVCTRAFGHDVLVGRFCASSNSLRRSARANSPRLWRQSHLAFRAVCLRDAGTTGWSRVAAPDSASATMLRASPVRSSSCGRSAAIRTRRLERFGWGSRRRVGSRLRLSSIGIVRGGTRAGPLAASIAVVCGRGTMRSDVFGSITLIGRSSGPRSCKPKRPIAPKIWGHVPDTWTDWWRDS